MSKKKIVEEIPEVKEVKKSEHRKARNVGDEHGKKHSKRTSEMGDEKGVKGDEKGVKGDEKGVKGDEKGVKGDEKGVKERRSSKAVIPSPPPKRKGWWKRKTKLERALIIYLAIVLLGVILLILAIIHHYHYRYSDLCITPECVDEARYLLTSVDLSVNACDDFYLFACGAATKRIVSKNQPSVNVETDVKAVIIEQVAQIVGIPILDSDPKPTQLIKTMYSLCLGENSTGESADSDLKAKLAIAGGWPLAGGTSGENILTWSQVSIKLRELGMHYESLIAIDLFDDLENSAHMIVLDLPQVKRFYKGMPLNDYKYLVEYITGLAEAFGSKKAAAATEIDNMLKLLYALEEVWKEKTAWHKVPIQHLIDKIPTIPWVEHINGIVNPVTPVTPDTKIIAKFNAYSSRLATILTQHSARTVANYLIWSALEHLMPFLPIKYRKLEEKFEQKIGEKALVTSRSDDCIDVVSKSMPVAVAAEYAKKFVTEDQKQKAYDFVMNVHNGLISTLQDAEWLEDAIKTAMVDKYGKTKLVVSYPNEVKDQSLVNSAYEELNFDMATTPMAAYLTVKKFSADIKYGRLNRKFKKGDWFDHANIFETKVEYSEANILRVPAGVLLGHYYSENRPNYLNFGALGWLIAHKFSESIMTMVQQLHEPVEGKQSQADEFKKKSECLIIQYDKFGVYAIEKKVNGEKTLKQNFADNGGLNIAFKSYLKWSSDNSKELLIPGFHRFNGNKMFWIAAAAVHCTAYRAHQLEIIISTSFHAPAQFRVIGSFSNSKEFSKYFECREETPMNPKEKCDIF